MAKHDRTLEAVFAKPTRADLRWSAVVSLVENRGGVVTHGNGSRHRIVLNGLRATFHRPHPGDLMKKCLVEDLRDFLTSAGVKP